MIRLSDLKPINRLSQLIAEIDESLAKLDADKTVAPFVVIGNWNDGEDAIEEIHATVRLDRDYARASLATLKQRTLEKLRALGVEP